MLAAERNPLLQAFKTSQEESTLAVKPRADLNRHLKRMTLQRKKQTGALQENWYKNKFDFAADRLVLNLAIGGNDPLLLRVLIHERTL